MIFQYLVLDIFTKIENERTVSSPYHLLKGKRSGHTIQDVGIFGLHSYFGILPKLEREQYDEVIQHLINQHYIILFDNSYFQVTNTGREILKNQQGLSFNGWKYRGNEHIFFSRLSLTVQSLSHVREKVMSFIPIQKDEGIQHWVRNFLLKNQYKSSPMAEHLYHEIVQSLNHISINEKAKEMVVKRLSGYHMPGFTWQQLCLEEGLQELDVHLIYVACLHEWLNEILKNPHQYPLLRQLAENVCIEFPLTGSAYQTSMLFKKGYSIEEISHKRRLKQSTIEDHLIELAMNDPSFPIEQFITKEDIQQVFEATEMYDTKKLKVLHEVLPHLSYFQLRLALARGESTCN